MELAWAFVQLDYQSSIMEKVVQLPGASTDTLHSRYIVQPVAATVEEEVSRRALAAVGESNAGCKKNSGFVFMRSIISATRVV